MPNPQKKKERFVSLVFKAILAVSFATFIASASVFVIGKITLDNNYQQERKRARNFYKQAFDSILQRSKIHDVNIGWLIPSFSDADSNEVALKQIQQFLDKNWFLIEVESDIRWGYLLSNNGEFLGKWGTQSEDISPYTALYEFVIIHEQPIDQIICELDCKHIYVSPFLHNGAFIGVFIFAVDLAETVIQMQGITGADIGILVKQNSLNVYQSAPAPYLAAWSSAVISLTHATENLPLLKKLSQHIAKHRLLGSVRYKFHNKVYEISTIPFLSEHEHGTADLILIDDITAELGQINKAVLYYAASGLISLLLSGCIILLLLMGPTRKLRALISVLPLIAEKNYLQVLKKLPKQTNKQLFNDEISVLDDATHNLIFTLKELDREVEIRTNRLSEQAIELQNEKNFVSNILDTAQVIIMTLDNHGRILSLNKYTENLTGHTEQALFNTSFTDFIFDLNNYTSTDTILDELVTNHRKTFRSECSIFSTTGTELYISWYFTLINKPDAIPEILAVGLNLTERKEIESQLTWLADHDPLTNLFNRRRFEQELHKTLNLAIRYQQTGALIFFDVDQFKFINDSSGHNIGDELLIKIAEHLLVITRETDVVARFGGDEFVVLAPQIKQDDAEELTQKICNEMSHIEISGGNSTHRVSISAGLLMFPVEGFTEMDLIASVDLAMYKAKAAGRGGWYRASIDDLNRKEVKKRVDWKSKIEKALKDERLVLYFQPIMRVSDKSIAHYECLLRMQDEAGNIVPPGMFLTVAEQTGLMHKIDARVLQLAFEHQSEFIKQNIDITLSVNLSGDMISHPETMNLITGLNKKTRVPLSKFIFEITESQAVTNLPQAQNLIRLINQAGGCFALDDFGVGFSSMSYLKQLPIKYIKIDGGFIKNLVDSREDKLFVNAINSVGKGLSILTIAEFVNSPQVLDILYLIGVDYAQGNGIGLPMPQPEYHISISGKKPKSKVVLKTFE